MANQCESSVFGLRQTASQLSLVLCGLEQGVALVCEDAPLDRLCQGEHLLGETSLFVEDLGELV